VIQEAGELIFVPSGWHHEAEETCPSLKDFKEATLLETNSKRAPEKLLLYLKRKFV